MDGIRALRLSPLLLLALGLLTSCASGPPPGPSPAELAGQSAQTIVVSPFNVVTALPPELEGSTKMVRRALVDQLKAHGKTVQVMGFRAGRDLWEASMKEVRESGQKRNFDNAAIVYARKIREHLDFDALIVPSIFVQNAKARGRVARWDGAEQKIEIQGRTASNKANRYSGMGGSWNIRAASIFVHVLDSSGKSIQTKRAGLELIEHLQLNVERDGGFSGSERIGGDVEPDRPPIGDEEAVRAGVRASLSPFLPEEVPEKTPPPLEAAPASE